MVITAVREVPEEDSEVPAARGVGREAREEDLEVPVARDGDPVDRVAPEGRARVGAIARSWAVGDIDPHLLPDGVAAAACCP